MKAYIHSTTLAGTWSLFRGPLQAPGTLLFVVVLLTFFFQSQEIAFSQAEEALTQTYRISLAGDVIAAGVGLRGSGEGEIELTGIPDNGSVVKAFLYWGTLGTTGAYTSLIFNGETITGTLVGTSANTCWSTADFFTLRNYVYRADVTDLVAEDGIYTLEGLPDDLESGNDSQGASLVVIYTVPGYPFRTILINDGAVTLDLDKNSYTDTLSGFIADEPLALAQVTYIIGDGQPEWSTGAIAFNGETIAADVIDGGDGEYWDTLSFEVTGLVSASPATTSINNAPSSPGSPDCIAWAATVFSITSPEIEPADVLDHFQTVSLHGNATAAGVGLRGSGAGEIVIDGIPEGAGVRQALLYWGTIGTTGTYDTLALNDQPVSGELIATSANTCWDLPQAGLAFYNFIYRADVTALFDGNGTYTITGLPDELEDGNDSQGASLVVIYTTPSDGLFRTILIYDGAVTLDLDQHSHSLAIDGYGLSDPVLDAKITYLVGDGQTEWTSGEVLFNGHSLGSNVFSGMDGDYWDTRTFDVPTYVSGTTSTTTVNNSDGVGPDCMVWAGAIFAVTPPQPEYQFQYFMPVVNK
jgi:hypothetical protein